MEKQEWYAVRTFPSYEQKVAEKLKKQISIEGKESVISKVYIPVRKRFVFVRGHLKLKEELLFPGYMFVRMEFTDDTFYFVRGIQYVTGYAGISSMKQIPKPMKDSEYETMALEVEKIEIDLAPGDLVTIVNHDLYEGEVVRVNAIDTNKCKMDVLLPNEMEITIDFMQVMKK